MAACVFSADSDSVFAPEHQISLYIFISTERADRKIQRFDFFTLSLGQIFISLQKHTMKNQPADPRWYKPAAAV